MKTTTAGRPIAVHAFSTRNFAPQERLDVWRDLVGGSYTLSADPVGFEAEARLAQIDGMIFRSMTASVQSVGRTAAQIRRDGLEHFSLHLNHAGYCFSSARGDGVLHPGEISINDLTRPFERSAALERDSIVLSLPRDAVERIAPQTSLHGAVLGGPVATLFATHMQMLASRMAELPQAAARPLMDSTLAMLGAALSTYAPDTKCLDAARALAAKRHIRRNLSRVSLGPETIARDLRISRTTLYRLFEAEGGVAHYISRRRLAAAAAALRDPDDLRSISALVVAFGFGSASSLARAFRARYGMSPSDFRLARRDEPEDFSGAAYAAWLRQIA